MNRSPPTSSLREVSCAGRPSAAVPRAGLPLKDLVGDAPPVVVRSNARRVALGGVPRCNRDLLPAQITCPDRSTASTRPPECRASALGVPYSKADPDQLQTRHQSRSAQRYGGACRQRCRSALGLIWVNIVANLDIIYGEATNPALLRGLVATLQSIDPTGTLYLGYPVLASADSRISIDAMLISREHGLVAFLFGQSPPTAGGDPWEPLRLQQDALYGALESYLGRHPSLRSGRRLAFDINTVTILPTAPPPSAGMVGGEGLYVDLTGLVQALATLSPITDAVKHNLDAAVNKVSTIRPSKKRANVTREDSRGARLKAIEKEIANLDRWQKRSAIEVPDGVQRIRGLAGSGKTVVLALKAAYLHAQHPDWRIALTFYTRSLYQQLEDLTRRFCFEHLLDEPDWTKLQILHSWGSMRDRSGIYTTLAVALGHPIRDWASAKALYGQDNAFAGICRELLDAARARSRVIEPVFDAVLIDEAQDLPQEFFELVAIYTRAPRRIAFAYDELQQLSAEIVPSVETLFGRDDVSGLPRMRLGAGAGNARDDVVLPVCYRNPPWTLTVAHAIGFGIYRNGGLVQHFDNASLWKEVGYRVNSGNLADGNSVALSRDPNSYPRFFVDQLTAADAVVFTSFATDREQLQWVAKNIQQNLEKDEIDADDILVVLPNTYTAKSRSVELVRALNQHGVTAHLVGATSSQDRMFKENSVAITHIYRAKGNEAAMVYVVDAEYAVANRSTSAAGLASRRNILFTAITRAKAWVRVTGVGSGMRALCEEYQKVVSHDYQLVFKIPTPEERGLLRQLHRDRSETETAARREAIRSVEGALEAIDRGDIDMDDLPPDVRRRLKNLANEPSGDS